MDKHGIVRKKPFTLVEKTGDSLTFVQTDDDESVTKYPYNLGPIAGAYDSYAIRVYADLSKNDQRGVYELPLIVEGNNKLVQYLLKDTKSSFKEVVRSLGRCFYLTPYGTCCLRHSILEYFIIIYSDCQSISIR